MRNPAEYPYLESPSMRVSPICEDNFLIEFDDRINSQVFDRLPSMVLEQMESLRPKEPRLA